MTSVDDYLFWNTGRLLDRGRASELFRKLADAIKKDYSDEIKLPEDLDDQLKILNQYFKDHGINYRIKVDMFENDKSKMFSVVHL